MLLVLLYVWNVNLLDFYEAGKAVYTNNQLINATFKSHVTPPLNEAKLRMSTNLYNSTNLTRYGSLHVVSIDFINCQEPSAYQWLPEEFIEIKIFQPNLTVKYLSLFNKAYKPWNSLRFRCKLVLHIWILMEFNNFFLQITQHFSAKESIVENIYPIYFPGIEIIMELNGNLFYVEQIINLTCYVYNPFKKFYVEDNPLNFTVENFDLDYSILSMQKTFYESGLKVSLMFHSPGDSQLTCKTLSTEGRVSHRIKIKSKSFFSTLVWLVSINHVSMAICVTLVLILLVILGIYSLVCGSKRRLTRDKLYYYTERVNEDIPRIPDYLLNELTKTSVKYPLPGVLATHTLRRNVNKLFITNADKQAEHRANMKALYSEPDFEKQSKDAEKQSKDAESGFSGNTLASLKQSQSQEMLTPKFVQSPPKTGKTLFKQLEGLTAVGIGSKSQITPKEKKFYEDVTPMFESYPRDLLDSEDKDDLLEKPIEPSPSVSKEEQADHVEPDSIVDDYVLPVLPYIRIYDRRPYWDMDERQA